MASKTLIAFYSRTGITKQLAEKLSKLLKADICEIIDKTNRQGVIGYLKAGKDAMNRNLTEIICSKSPEKYQTVIIGTPNWAGNICPAARTYLENNKDKLKSKKLAFFCTHGGESPGKILAEFSKYSKPIAFLNLRTIEVKENSAEEKISQFIKNLK